MRGDLDALQLEVLGAPRRQRSQHGAFGVDTGSVASVVATLSGGAEVGQAEATGWIPLGEDHLLCGAMQGAPLAHAALEGAAHADRELWMAAAQFVEDGHRTSGQANTR